MDTAIRRTHPRRRPEYGKIVIYIVLLLGCVITLAPFVWMFLTSMKTSMEAVSIPPSILPRAWNTDAYTSLGNKLPFFQMYWNTILTSVIIVAGQLLLCSLAGYAFARIRFPGRNFLFVLCLSVLMIPSSFLILPQYLIIQKMKLLNTLHAIYLPNLFSAFGTFLMRQFFMTIPLELEDAARIDGCGHGRTYLRIMLPLIKPGLVSLGVLTLRFAWNNLMWPMIVNTEKAKMTLSAGLSYLQGQYITDYPSIMAGAMLATIPLIIIYAIFQRQFIEGIALTGIK
ncbi:carbohydrate ABC transporter permease [Clostridiales bacterium]|nr:carbohydrate ABC transporter permease [Clostridiales bacterium]